jgi:hypothetical protein
VASAPSGASIAIAAGTYGPVTLDDETVKLWGRCPDMVTIDGGGNAAVTVHGGVDGTEIHGVALTGYVGLLQFGSTDVVLSQIWVHDTELEGIYLENEEGPASAVLRDSLVSDAQLLGVSAAGAEITVERSEVRGTTSVVADQLGYGVAAAVSPNDGATSHLTVDGSLIEGNQSVGVIADLAAPGSVSVTASVIRRQILDSTGASSGLYVTGEGEVSVTGSSFADDGGGLFVAASGLDVRDTTLRGSEGASVLMDVGAATVERSSVADYGAVGILLLADDAALDGVVVRDSVNSESSGGIGIQIQGRMDGTRLTHFDITQSLVSSTRDVGIVVLGGQGRIARTAVVDTAPRSDGTHGRGIQVQHVAETGLPSLVDVEEVSLMRNREGSLNIVASDVTVRASEIRDTGSNDAIASGRGIQIQDDPVGGRSSSAVISTTLVEQSHTAGIMVVDSSAEILSSVVRDTAPDESQNFGDGIAVLSLRGLAETAVSESRVIESDRVGLSVFGATVSLERTLLLCQAIDVAVESVLAFESSLTNGGDTWCGCPGPVGDCKLLSSDLAPPPPIE